MLWIIIIVDPSSIRCLPHAIYIGKPYVRFFITSFTATTFIPVGFCTVCQRHSPSSLCATIHSISQVAAPQAVIVTGTRSLNRTVTDSEAPIDIFTSKDLQTTGATDIGSALNRLLPSLNFPSPAVADATSANRPAQLRGLSPDQTLVLVNGKRWD